MSETWIWKYPCDNGKYLGENREGNSAIVEQKGKNTYNSLTEWKNTYEVI